MPNIVLIILAVVVAAIVGLVIVIAMRPAAFQIERSNSVVAPPAAVFEYVNDLHNWEAWSPWAKIDPMMKTTYEGPAAGPGSSYAWNGNSKVGQGRMTILDSRANEVVHIKLQFLRPFAATNDVEFTFKPEASETAVTWRMTGKNNFMLKAFGLFMSMDKMVGKDFEKGLAQLKTQFEGTHQETAIGQNT